MDHTGDVQQLFDAIVKQTELSMAAREFDNTDPGDGLPSPDQVRSAVEILRQARQLRRLLRS